MEDPTKIKLTLDPFKQRLAGGTHYDVDFDVPYMSHVTGNLWQGGCANGLVLPTNIEHVVSLYPWERYTVGHQLKSMLSVVMYDSVDQAFGQVEAIARWVASCMEDGPTLVHCQAGLNRSGLVAAVTLVLKGMHAPDALDLLRAQRANPDGTSAVLCNPAFEKHVLTLEPYLGDVCAAFVAEQAA
jgi:protein-tyrosine phosphatase